MFKSILSCAAMVLIACGTGAAIVRAEPAPATQPSEAIEPKLLNELIALDQRIGAIQSLRARFVQSKFTPLLRKPLVSSGMVRVKGPLMRWDTDRPEQSVIATGQGELKMYYPDQKVMEVYQLDQRMSQLAASPLPRLDVLRRYFAMERTDATPLVEAWKREVGQDASDTDQTASNKSRYLALRLTPVDPSLKRHLAQVVVLMDKVYPCILRAEMTDGDHERTVLDFSHIELNKPMTDAEATLTVPADTTISHPMAGMEKVKPDGR